MGYAIAAAVGAKIGDPQRKVLAVTGDAAWKMSSAEIHTATEYGVSPVVVCLQNGGHATVELGARHQYGGQAPSAMFRRPVAIADAARAMHAEGVRVERSDQLGPALEAAFRSPRATVIEVVVDPDEMPPMGVRFNTLAGGVGGDHGR